MSRPHFDWLQADGAIWTAKIGEITLVASTIGTNGRGQCPDSAVTSIWTCSRLRRRRSGSPR